MGRKNISHIRRLESRGERPAQTSNENNGPLASPKMTRKVELMDGPSTGKLYHRHVELDMTWLPATSAVLKMMVSLRLASALWSTISDCDEVYNYWEPLHLMLFGEGFQTWEYSPIYAIRSYFYVYLHYMPANILHHLLPSSKIAVFVCLRCLLGLFCMTAEFLLYRAVNHRLGNSIGRLFLIFSIVSTGMFISCTAFLPSTFAMVMNMFAMAAYLNEQWFWAVFCTAVASLVGWPFAALLGLPIAVHMLIVKHRELWQQFFSYSIISGLLVSSCISSVDSFYYGKPSFPPLNIVMYNIFSAHGPDLYGTEPLSFYLKNLLLNWNLAALLTPLALPLACVVYMSFNDTNAERKVLGLPLNAEYWRRFTPVIMLFLGLTAWCLVFFLQPHKEERFLFPIYPMIALFAAVALDAIERLISRGFAKVAPVIWLVVLAFFVISMSRTYAIHKNFGAHVEIYKNLNERLMDTESTLDFSQRRDPLRLCVGKEWYRFPSSFFLPKIAIDAKNRKRGMQLSFLKSEFAGLLPKPYAQGKIPDITKSIPTEMNDLNKEELSRYVSLDTCDYIIDVETPDITPIEPNYAADTDTWRRVSQQPFLISSRSHWFLRAFYVPSLSHKMNFWGNYVLLERIPPTTKTKK